MSRPNRSRGRPRRELMAPPLEQQIETLASVLTQEQLADYLQVSGATFRRRLQENARLLAAYKKGQASAVALVAQSLLGLATRGNVTAQIFYLKARAGWREQARHDLGTFNPDDFTDPELERIAAGEPVERVLARRGRQQRPPR